MATTVEGASEVVFRSPFIKRARMIANLLDAVGLKVSIAQQSAQSPEVRVAPAQAPRARQLLHCYGLVSEPPPRQD